MKHYLKLMGIVLVMLCFSTVVAHAESDNNVGFSVAPILPENQLDTDQGYFDLKMEPGQKETIEIQVFNTSSEASSFTINVNQAYTNASGFIDYENHDVKKDSSLKYNIDDIAKYEKSVTVDANSSVTVPIELSMPKESFDGFIMAGIQVNKDTDDSQTGITNAYGYTLGLRLAETDTEIKRELNLLEVKPAVSFGKTSVVAVLQNPTMDAYGHLKYQVKVTNLKTKEVEKEETFDSDMQMAPNSTYDFAIDWNNKELVPGKYNLDLIVTDAKSNEWKFNKDFEITKDDAKKVNQIVVGGSNNDINPWIIGLIAAAVLILLIVIIWIIRRKRKKRRESERRELTGTRRSV